MNQKEFVTLDRKEYEALLLSLGHLEGQPQVKKRGIFWSWFLQRPSMVMVALMMVGVLGAGAGALGLTGFNDGNKYLSSQYLYKVGYVAGVSDTISIVSFVDDATIHQKAINYCKCMRGGMTDVQLQAIAEKYLRDHPEEWHHSMASLVWLAVLESCPK